MKKKGKKLFIFNAVISEIILLISMTFAFAILLSEEGSAEYIPGEVGGVPVGDIPCNTPNPAALPARLGPGPNSDFSLLDKAASQSTTGTSGTGTTGTIMSRVKNVFGGKGFTGLSNPTNALIQGAAWGLVLYGAAKLILPLLGADKSTTNAVSNALLAGGLSYGVIKASIMQFAQVGPTTHLSGLTAGGWGFVGGAAIAIVVFLLTYKKEKKEFVRFECLPWEPQTGGSKCEECNKDSFRPCSEYRCKSLGQACELLNPGTKEAKCAWVSRNDVNSPKIIPDSAMFYPKDLGLKYVPDSSIRPPSIGSKIVSSKEKNGCLKAFTPLQFGFSTDEPAQCKIEYNHTTKMEEMQFYVGDNNYFIYNHTQIMKLPGSDLIAPLLQNDGTFALFTRCKDANGNENVDEYVFKFCVDQGPDTTPPIIEGFSIPSGSYINFNKDNLDLNVYVNEPSDCRWSIQDKDYGLMENSMVCDKETYQINADLTYVCSGKLTGIKNRADNKFFFKCKDQPTVSNDAQRNTMMQSTQYIVKGSRPLDIISVSPNGTISGSTEMISVDLGVETSNGAMENGNATCYVSSNGTSNSFIEMFETNSWTHKQTYSNLVNGNYTFYFRCLDAGGNAAENKTSFMVFVDKQAPIVTRVYRDISLNSIKVVTNKNAECVYSASTCNYQFKDGQKLMYAKSDVRDAHYAEWKDAAVYYIKCKDDFGNQPDESKCNLVVKSIDLVNSDSEN